MLVKKASDANWRQDLMSHLACGQDTAGLRDCYVAMRSLKRRTKALCCCGPKQTEGRERKAEEQVLCIKATARLILDVHSSGATFHASRRTEGCHEG